MKLYNGAAPNPRRVRIFLAEKGIDVPLENLELQKGETRTPAYLAKNSLGHIPILELEDGTIITESIAICRFFEAKHPDPPLFGTDVVDQAKVEMWNRRMEIEVFGPIGNVAQHTHPFFADKVKQMPDFAQSQREVASQKWQWLEQEMADGRPVSSTCKWRETADWVMGNWSTSSPTDRSPSESIPRMARRVGSASAANVVSSIIIYHLLIIC